MQRLGAPGSPLLVASRWVQHWLSQHLSRAGQQTAGWGANPQQQSAAAASAGPAAAHSMQCHTLPLSVLWPAHTPPTHHPAQPPLTTWLPRTSRASLTALRLASSSCTLPATGPHTHRQQAAAHKQQPAAQPAWPAHAFGGGTRWMTRRRCRPRASRAPTRTASRYSQVGVGASSCGCLLLGGCSRNRAAAGLARGRTQQSAERRDGGSSGAAAAPG